MTANLRFVQFNARRQKHIPSNAKNVQIAGQFAEHIKSEDGRRPSGDIAITITGEKVEVEIKELINLVIAV
ncbi:MAG TPA: hypothetical protein VH815_01370 [Acidobacteriota bacterium]